MVLSALMIETHLPPFTLDAALANSTGSQPTQAVVHYVEQPPVHSANPYPWGWHLFVWEGYGLELRFSDF